MGACDCVMIGVGNHKVIYGICDVLERRNYIEVHNFVGSTTFGSSAGFFLSQYWGHQSMGGMNYC